MAVSIIAGVVDQVVDAAEGPQRVVAAALAVAVVSGAWTRILGTGVYATPPSGPAWRAAPG